MRQPGRVTHAAVLAGRPLEPLLNCLFASISSRSIQRRVIQMVSGRDDGWKGKWSEHKFNRSPAKFSWLLQESLGTPALAGPSLLVFFCIGLLIRVPKIG